MSGNAGRLLRWSDVSDGASGLFNVWAFGGEMEWAERAWAMMEKAGLTSYGDAVEETRVRVRLLALASIYWDFCRLGADEDIGWDELHEHAIEGLGIAPIRVGQMVGPRFDADDYGSDAVDLVESALRQLIGEERPAIGAALIKGWGGEWTFLKALFASIKLPADPPDDDDVEAGEDDEPDVSKSAPVMAWIMEGMPCK